LLLEFRESLTPLPHLLLEMLNLLVPIPWGVSEQRFKVAFHQLPHDGPQDFGRERIAGHASGSSNVDSDHSTIQIDHRSTAIRGAEHGVMLNHTGKSPTAITELPPQVVLEINPLSLQDPVFLLQLWR
jgi:hypothetical protein